VDLDDNNREIQLKEGDFKPKKMDLQRRRNLAGFRLSDYGTGMFEI
jgi:hypothetical protein